MSTRLDRALHELADAAASDATLGGSDAQATTVTVRRLAAQVRRRRAARATGSAAVAACAAGAVAVVWPQLSLDVAPAGDPDAPAGTCRSNVETLPVGLANVLSLDLGLVGPDGDTRVDPARAGYGLGTWQGGTADLQVRVTQLPQTAAGPTRLRLLVSRDDVVLATDDTRLAGVSVPSDEVAREEFGLTVGPGTSTETVHPLAGGDEHWWQTSTSSDGELIVSQSMSLPLDACDGSGPLPAGTYQVWATTVDAEGDARGAAGPWDLVVAEEVDDVHELPDGFPDVPLVDGRLVAAHRHGDGWAAEVVTPGEDRVDVATLLLETVGERADGTGPGGVLTSRPAPGTVVVTREGTALTGWSVRAVASRTPDGQPSVVYILTPPR